jgi:putative hydrolase of the HAD superfamily
MSRWIHPGIRAVFFDAVGTLLHPEPSAPVIYAAAARRQGLDLSAGEVRERFVTAFRTEERADRAAGWVTSEARELARWRRIVAETLAGVPDPEGCFAELFDHFARPAAWRVDPHAAALFARLQDRSVVVGLASNYDARLWSVVSGHPELAPLADRVVVSATVGFRKPAPEFFAEVVRVAGCAPGEILFVGDDLENDYEGATAAGMPAVLLDPRGRFPGVDRRISELGELVADLV